MPAMSYGTYGHLWKVQFTAVFSSSSGTQPYSNPPERGDVYVTSWGRDLAELEVTLRESLGSQFTVTLDAAQYLGKVYQPKRPA